MISTTFNRYIWLVNTLIQSGRLTFEEISRKWEYSSLGEGKPLSLRTFHAHRKAVEELFQIDILCDASDGYKYYIEDLSVLRENKTRQWLFNSFSTVNLIAEGRQMQDRILLEDIPKGTEYLQTFIEAMKQNRIVTITYRPFYEAESTFYHVSPYCLKVYRQRWYMLGYCEELNGIRHFSLDRIQNMNTTETGFDYPFGFSPEAYYKDSIGIWVNEKIKPEKVIIRTYGIQSQYLRTLPLHHSQKEIYTSEQYCDFEYKLCITQNLISELLAKGNAVQVMEPESLRIEMKKNLYNMFNFYK